MVSVPIRLLWRDLWQMRAQVLAAILVVGCGVAMFVTMRSAYLALLNTQRDYYVSYRFADLSVHLKRVPLEIAPRAAALSGVSHVDARVVSDVTVDIPGLSEPATMRPVSTPEFGRPALNLLHLQSGRYIAPDREDEVLVNAAFAEANSLRAGKYFSAILNGRWKCLHVVGLITSSEYVYEAGADSIFPDNHRYDIVWVGGNTVSAAPRMDGAFNDLALSLGGGVPVPHVIVRTDRTSLPYGGLGTISCDHRPSNRFITDEIVQNRVTTIYVLAIFFLIAIFLLRNVLT